MPSVQIDPRFHGPPHSANGGYACGVVAALADGPVAVSLRLPPPLGRELDATVDDDGVRVHDGGTLVAEAVPADPVDVLPPMAVDLDTARAAMDGYLGFEDHMFPTCWVCGPERPDGDGLHLYTGPVAGAPAGTGLVASTWTPDADVDDGTGHVAAEQVWAALDCPTFFGAASGDGTLRPAVLARLNATQHAPVPVGEELVVLGWTTHPADGRKHHGASAILTADGTVLAAAEALWVALSPEALEQMLESS